MKKIRLSVLFALILISLLSLCVLSTSAADPLTGSCGDEVTWTLDTTTGEMVISGTGPMTDYAITTMPPWIASCGSITSVTVEEGVTSLGAYAFLYCSNLVKVSLPESLTAIGANAFSNCSRLTEIGIPAGVRQIGMGMFQNCAALTEMTIPDGVTEIPGSLFSGCSKLTRVELPAGITSIGSNAFAGCTILTDIELPVGLSTIGSKAFAHCSSLETMILPCTLTSLGDGIFVDVPLRMVLFDGAQDEWDNVAVGENNALLTSVLLIHPDHVFNREVAEPAYLHAKASCTAAASYYRTCVCGEVGEETFSHGEPLGHTGGTATCLAQAICEVCGEPYGVLGTHIPNREATCTEGFECAVCGVSLKDPLGHDYVPMVTPPTCTEAGFTTHTCSRCEDTYTDTPTEPTGHTEGAPATCTEDQLCTVCRAVLNERLGHAHVPATVLEPTCTEPGLLTYTCSRCDDTYDEAIDPNGHTEGDPATCEAPQLCTVCGLLLAPPLGHELESETVEATCVARGYTAHSCSRCTYVYHDTFTDPKGHIPGEEATCTEPQTCTVCQGILTEPLGHAYDLTVVEPTCTEQGYTSHACHRCGHTYLDTYTDAKGHTSNEEASCTHAQICADCGAVMDEAKGHDYTHVIVAPTVRGYTTHTCSRCEHTYLDSFTDTVPHTLRQEANCFEPQSCSVCGGLIKEAIGHEYRATVVAATCTNQGYTKHICIHCSASYMDNFTPAKGHVPGKAATCTESQLCTVCQSILAPATGHRFEENVIAPTCTEKGYTVHTCSACESAYVDAPTEPTGHVPGAEASCYAPQTCTVCSAVLAQRLEHVFEETRIEPTCTLDGQVLHVCTLCEFRLLQSVIPATGHTVGEWELDNHPDIGEPGRQHKSCVICSEIMEYETFWDDDPSKPSDDSELLPETGSDQEDEESGCRFSGGNIAVIVIVIVAAGLLLFVDMKRR